MNLAEHNQSQSRGNRPISRHPLFPAAVSLWFAALLGLGSLAIRPGLLESLMLSPRISAIVPSSAPPPGFTFRVLLALAMAALGGALGALIARRLSRRHSASRASSRVEALIGDEAVNAVDPDCSPDCEVADGESEFSAGYFDERSALPADAPPILNVADVDADALEDEAVPVETAGFSTHERKRLASMLGLSRFSATPEQQAEAIELLPQEASTEAFAGSVPSSGPSSRIVSAELAELSQIELVERLALSLQRRREKLRKTDETRSSIEPVSDAEPPFRPLPAALRPIAFDSSDEMEDDFPLPARHIAMPATAKTAETAVTGPIAAPADTQDPVETERALRAALSTLQRMSSTA